MQSTWRIIILIGLALAWTAPALGQETAPAPVRRAPVRPVPVRAVPVQPAPVEPSEATVEPAAEPAPQVEPAPTPVTQQAAQPTTVAASPTAPAAARPKADVLLQYANAPISQVVRRFSDRLGKPLIGPYNVQGTVTFFDSRPYTEQEAFDTVNMILAMQGYRMHVINDQYLTLVPLDNVPNLPVPIIRGQANLESVRAHELVTVLLPLKYITPEVAGDAVVRMVNSYGALAKLSQAKGLLITDEAENIRRIAKMLDLMDTQETVASGDLQLETVELQRAPAASVAKVISDLYGPNSVPRQMAYSQERRRYEPVPPGASEVVQVTFDERTNIVFLRGEGPKLLQAKEMALKLDEQEGPAAGDVRIFALQNAKAEDLANVIRQAVPQQGYNPRDPRSSSAQVRVVADPNTNRLVVSAPIEQMVKIEAMIKELDGVVGTSEGGSRIFRLKHADAGQLSNIVLNATRTIDPRSGRSMTRLTVAAEPRGNTLIVSGPAAEIEMAAKIIEEIDQAPDAAAREIRVIQLKSGDARTIASALMRVLGESTAGRMPTSTSGLRVEADPVSNSLIIAASPGDWPTIETILKQWEDSIIPQVTATTQLYKLQNAEAGELARTLQNLYAQRGRPRSSADVPVVIAANERANTILVSAAKDEQTLIAQLIADMDIGGEQVDEVMIVSLQAADATQVANTLRTMLPPPPRGQQQTVFISSDRLTNSVLLRAPIAQRKQIEDMIAKLDTATVEFKRTTRIYPLQHASAAAVVSVLTQLYSGSAQSIRSRQPNMEDAERVVITAAPGDRAIVIDAAQDKIDAIIEVVKQLDGEGLPDGKLLPRTYALNHANAQELARSLTRLFAEQRTRNQPESGEPQPRFEAEPNSNQLLVAATVTQYEVIDQLISTMEGDAAKATTKVIELINAEANEVADALNAALTGSSPSRRTTPQLAGLAGRKLVVVPIAGSRSLLLTGSDEDIAFASDLIAQLDARGSTSLPVVQTYKIQHGKAESIARVLNDTVVRGQPRVSRGAAPPAPVSISADIEANAIVVSAGPDVQETVKALLAQLDTPEAAEQKLTVELVRLTNAKAVDLADALNQAGGVDPRRRQADQVQATADAASNTLLLTGRPEDIAVKRLLIEQLDQTTATLANQLRVFALRHAKAEDLVETMEAMLADSAAASRNRRTPTGGAGEARVAAQASTNSLIVQGPPDKVALAAELVAKIDVPDSADAMVIEIVPLTNAQAGSLADAVNAALAAQQASQRGRGPAPAGQTQQVFVTAEPNSNSVLVRGPADEVKAVVEMVHRLDSSGTGGAMQVRTYPLKNNDALDMSVSLGKLFGDMIRQMPLGRNQTRPPFAISADVRTNSLVVSTTMAHFAMFEELLNTLEKTESPPLRDVQFVQLTNADAFDVAAKLSSLFIDAKGPDKPIIETDYYSNSLTIIAKELDYKKMLPIIEQLDKTPVIEVRVIPITSGSVTDLAATLQRVYPQMSDSPVKIVEKIPGRVEIPSVAPSTAPATQPMGPGAAGPVRQPSILAADDTGVGIYGQEFPLNSGLGEYAAVEKPPVVIAPDEKTRSLIVSATRQEMQNINSLINQLTVGFESAEAEFRWFKIEKADPVSVAAMLEKLFNPPRQQQQQQGRQPQQRGGQQGQQGQNGQQPQQQAPAAPPVITVAADVRTRSVIVRAKPKDFELVEPIIKQLDQVTTVVTELRTFPLKNTDATEVAANIRELFQLASTSGGGRAGQPNQQRAEAIRQMIEMMGEEGATQVDASTMVSVTANRATNAVVVAAPADAMTVIAGFIQELDQSLPENRPVVRLYPVTGDDVAALATTIQQVFAAGGGAVPFGGRTGRGGATTAAAVTQAPVNVTADEAGKLLIISTSEDQHELVAQVLKDIQAARAQTGETVVKVYKIVNTTASSVAQALSGTLSASASPGGTRGRPGSTAGGGQLRINADTGSNSLVVSASPEDHARIAELLKDLDTLPSDEYAVRTIVLNHADATSMAQTLQRVYVSGGASRGRTTSAVGGVTIEPAPSGRALVVRADDETYEKIRALALEIDVPTTGKAKQEVFVLENAQAQSVASALSTAFRPPSGQRFAADDLVTVVAEPASNALIVTASDENMAKVRALLPQLDKADQGLQTEFVILKNARAQDLAQTLSQMAAAARNVNRNAVPVTVAAEVNSNALVMTGRASDLDKYMEMARVLDEAGTAGTPGVYILPLEKAKADTMAAMINDLYRQQQSAARTARQSVEPLAVTADMTTNSLIIAGSEAKYREVQTWVNQLEQMSPKRTAPRLIKLENADPAEVQKAIQQLLGSSAPPRRSTGATGGSTVSAGGAEVTVLPGQRQLLIDASDEDFAMIQELVKSLEEAAKAVKPDVKVFQLQYADNVRVATLLTQTFRSTTGRPEDTITVTALPQTKAVAVAASAEKMTEVEAFIRAIDNEQISPQMEYRIYPLVNAQPSKVLNQLNQLLAPIRQTRPNDPITVTVDEVTRSVIVTARAETFDQIDRIIKVIDTQPSFPAADVLVLQLRRADATQLAGVLTQMLRPSASGQVTPEALALQEQIRRLRVTGGAGEQLPELDLTKPIKITADPQNSGQQGSNALIIQSTPDNLLAMRAIVELMDTVPVSEAVRVQLMHLVNADATAVMNVLREIFTQGQQRLTGRTGTSVAGKAEPESISGRALTTPFNVSADVRTNTLVLSGTEESLALAQLVIKDLDRDSARIVTEVRLFKLQHADVTRITPVLQAVFAEGTAGVTAEVEGVRTQVNRLQTVLDGGRGHVSEVPRSRPALTIQADQTTNVVVVAARSDIMPLIADVIEKMDIPGAGTLNTVRIIPLNHADASRMQGVIEGLYSGSNAALIRQEDRPTITVDTRTNALVISASEKTFAMIDALLAKLDAQLPIDLRDIRLLPMKNADAASLASTLQQMMDARVQRQESLGVKDAAALGVLIIPDMRTNSLIIGGSAESYQIVKELAEQLDGASPALSGQIQMFALVEANAGTLATTLTNLFNQRYAAAQTPDVARQKPIILPDVRTNSLLVAANQDDSRVLESLLAKLDVKLADPAVRLVVVPLKFNDAGIVGPMIQDIFAARLTSMTPPGQTPAPQDRVDVATDALANALILSASKENLGLIDELLRKVDVEPPTETGIVRMFPLKNADAQRVSTMLRSLISQGLYKPGLAAAQNNAILQARERVAIEVDLRTNVLIVSASKENFAVLEEIINRVDSSETFALYGDVQAYLLQRADATRLADTLQEFFNSKRSAEEQASGGTGRSLALTVVADGRTNTLLLAGSREDMATAEKMIKQLDGETVVAATEFRVFHLQQGTAAVLQPVVEQLFSQRVVREGQQRDPVTVLSDARSNALVVGASPSDMLEVAGLIERLDVPPRPGETVRVFPLKKANPASVQQTLEGLFQTQGGPQAAGVTIGVDERRNAVIVSAGQADMERMADLIDKLDSGLPAEVTTIQVFTLRNADAAELAALLNATLTNKPDPMTDANPNRQTLIQFIRTLSGGQELVTTVLQEGVLISANVRANALVVVAPRDSMPLLSNLIEAMDSIPPRAAEIRAFVLENADATRMADVLQQLFRLTGATGSPQAVNYTLVSTQPSGEVEGPTAAIGSAQQAALTVTVDTRTNTLLIGGTRQYVEMAAKVINELDSRPAQERITTVYRLKNAQGTDIQTAIRAWLTEQRASLTSAMGADLGAAARLLEQEVAVVAVTDRNIDVSNTLLISASPRYYAEVERIIKELDAPPPQVLIQVLLAEVTLTDETDFGFDWNFRTDSGSSTVNVGTRFGIAADIASGGFGVSVTGSDLEFFLRALKAQNRMQVLQRPQVVSVDNQPAEINVGQRVPFVSSSRVDVNGGVFNTISYENVGIILTVTPRISPDGFVRMVVSPEVSSIADSTVQISEGLNAIVVNSRAATTTVTVQDGHTAIIGGLITARDSNTETKVPGLGDAPWLGSLFKKTKTVKERTELLIILTPHIQRPGVDNRSDVMTNEQIRRLDQMRGVQKDITVESLFNPLSLPSQHSPFDGDEQTPWRERETEVIPLELLPARPTTEN